MQHANIDSRANQIFKSSLNHYRDNCVLKHFEFLKNCNEYPASFNIVNQHVLRVSPFFYSNRGFFIKQTV